MTEVFTIFKDIYGWTCLNKNLHKNIQLLAENIMLKEIQTLSDDVTENRFPRKNNLQNARKISNENKHHDI